MLPIENNYDFKTQLLTVHANDVREDFNPPKRNEFAFSDGIKISVFASESQVVMTAIRDFEDYLFTSMGVSVLIVKNDPKCAVQIRFGKNLGDGDGYMGYKITVEKRSLTVEGYDERGIAQGLYYLEDLMNLRKAPYVKVGVTARKALFSPRVTQSPLGMYEWCDQAFSILAHRGFDAIDLWIRDPWTDNRGYFIDINLIAERAKRYGIDVYVELYAPHDAHPDDQGAQEFYDNLYGKLFDVCPIIKGITLIGEATNFKSRDPNVGLAPYYKNYVDNIPTGKISPGWYPCCDYPKWVNMIKNAVRKKSKDAEIVFCSYNWGFHDEKLRLALVNALPTDITLLVTWDMFEQYKVGNSTEDIADYSLCFAGPGKYFISEASAAKARGIKVSAIANTSGRTWDFGPIPYEPMPLQWIKRYQNIQKAHGQLGLKGIVENIHYGFHPSFITDLEKQAFFTSVEPLTVTLNKLLERDFGKENLKKVKTATDLFSKGITYYVPTNEDQYGAFRIGPTYPLWSGEMEGLPSSIPENGRMPSNKHAMFGNAIYFGNYTPDNGGRNSLSGVRIFDEIKSLNKVREFMIRGIEELESITNKNYKLEKLILLAKFIKNSLNTTICVKEHFILKQQLKVAKTKANASKIIDRLEELVNKERLNVLDTIPIVERDSRLGWEPSMEYVTDKKSLEWKLRQLDYELTVKIPTYRKSNSL